jgi:lipoate-protein ligase A
MRFLDLTLATPQENVALDEALLDEAEEAAEQGQAAADFEILRLWESPQMVVVVGRSSRVADEVNLDECRRQGVLVLRRSSGGAAIVAGPGCLMYAVVLAYNLRPELRDIGEAHRFVLGRLAASLNRALGHATSSPPLTKGKQGGVPTVRCAGTSDLALGDQDHNQSEKCSGNSLRCLRHFLLYHGTLLYNLSIDEVAQLLRMPPRQPDYRAGRSHERFLTNLPLDRQTIRNAVVSAFGPISERRDWPRDRVAQLVASRFSRDDWNLQR